MTGYLLSDRDEDKQEEGPVMGEKAGKSPDFTKMESDLQGLRDDVAIFQVTLNELPPRGGTTLLDGKLGKRVREKIAEIERAKTARGNECGLPWLKLSRVSSGPVATPQSSTGLSFHTRP